MGWLLGLGLGVGSGLLPLLLGAVGLLAVVAAGIASAIVTPRSVVLSGFLAGTGGTWLIVWAQGSQACVAASTPTDGCVGPDLSGWQSLPILMLVAAGLIAVMPLFRGRGP